MQLNFNFVDEKEIPALSRADSSRKHCKSSLEGAKPVGRERFENFPRKALKRFYERYSDEFTLKSQQIIKGL
jgi:hypothetical protein